MTGEEFRVHKLYIKCTLGHCAIARTNSSDLKPSGDNVVGNMVLNLIHRAVNGFQERGHLGTGYSSPQWL